MAEKGASMAWLSVLVRGYANLALLTPHLWSSQHEAFAARSLVYAERMMLIDKHSATAQRHRAYSRAIIGASGSALEQLEALAKTADAEQPAWFSVVEPYVRCDHQKLRQAAADHPEVGQLAALLDWNLYRNYAHGRWIYEKGMDTMRACPEAYGTYSALANWPALMIERVGSAAGMQAFGQSLPVRVAELKDLPKSARAFAGEQSGILSRLLGTRGRRR